jgi:hypothetical protein
VSAYLFRAACQKEVRLAIVNENGHEDGCFLRARCVEPLDVQLGELAPNLSTQIHGKQL